MIIGSGLAAALIAEQKAKRPVHANFDLTLDQPYRFAKGSVASDAGICLP